MRRAQKRAPGEHASAQAPVLVVDAHSHHHGVGGGVDQGRERLDFSFDFADSLHRQRRLLPNSHLAHARRRHRGAQVEHPGVGDLDHRRTVAVDGLAGGDDDGRDHAGDGSADAAGGVRLLERALGRHQRGARIIHFLARGDAVLPQPLGASQLGARVLERGARVHLLRLDLAQALLERLRLDVRQHLADAHRVALGDVDAIDAAGHQRAHLDVFARQRRQHAGDGDARGDGLERDGRHLDHRPRHRLLAGAMLAARERHPGSEPQCEPEDSVTGR